MNRKKFLETTVLAGTMMTGFSLPATAMPPTSGALQPFYVEPDAKPLEPRAGLDIRTKIRSRQTGMQFSCVDFSVAPKQMGPAPHLHKELDELMYVHRGTIHVIVEDEVFEVKAGGWHFRPRGMVHTFWNAGDEIALGTDMYFNQNFEDYLEELFHTLIPEMIARNLTPASPEMAPRFAALDKRFGVIMYHDRRQAIVDRYGLKS